VLAVVPLLVVIASRPAALGLLHAAGVHPAAAVAAPAPIAQPVADPVPEHAAPVAASRSQTPAMLAWPAPGIITSPFGDHRGHPGIDIDGITGDPVTAAASGTVVGAGAPPPGFDGYGTIVAIDHGGGLLTLYAHLSRVDVATGQHVDTGQLLGAIGMTGIATGDHLHFEVRVNNVPMDPMIFLSPRPVSVSKPIPAPVVETPLPVFPNASLVTAHPE
jgi:murein DD-endopeptidase MepM/ murein hydrolase activator NlpD